jgi:hypothetical protein
VAGTKCESIGKKRSGKGVDAMKKGKLLITIFALLLPGLAACSVATVQLYDGQIQPESSTAIIETGPYANIEALDGKAVRALNVAVLPGTCNIALKPAENDQPLNSYLFYTKDAGLISFTAIAGHHYRVYVEIFTEQKPAGEIKGSGFVWVGSVFDKTADKKIAWTDALPIQAAPRSWPTGDFGPFFIR